MEMKPVLEQDEYKDRFVKMLFSIECCSTDCDVAGSSAGYPIEGLQDLLNADAAKSARRRCRKQEACS